MSNDSHLERQIQAFIIPNSLITADITLAANDMKKGEPLRIHLLKIQ